jgi:hypothetical protein
VKVINESSSFRILWDTFVLILVLVSTTIIPFQFAFQHTHYVFSTEILYVIDFFFLIDIYLNFFTSYRYQGVENVDRKKTATRYLKTLFAVDILANLPLDVFFLQHHDLQFFNISLVLFFRLFHLLRIVRLFVIFRRWEKLSWTNSGYLRITKFCLSVFLIIHWIACAWFVIAFIENFPDNCWVVIAGIRDTGSATQYIRSLYWTITTMTTVGFGDITPNRNIEYVFTSLMMLLGASLYAFIIGNIASLLSKIDTAKINFWNRIEAISQYLRYRQVPSDINERVKKYYEYLWERHRGLTGNIILDDLPKPLRLEVVQSVARELLANVPLFKYCSSLLKNELLMALKAQTYPPGCYVVQEGEIGKEIFFICRGKVEIISDKGEKRYGTMEDGEYFGDFSLIFNEKRTASVKTMTYCEIFVLNRDDFNRIKSEYSEFKDVLKKMSSEKTEKISALILDGIIL